MEWISVEDDLPEDQDIEPGNEHIWIYGKYGTMDAIYMDGKFHKGYSAVYKDESVTHWMKKPDKPKENP